MVIGPPNCAANATSFHNHDSNSFGGYCQVAANVRAYGVSSNGSPSGRCVQNRAARSFVSASSSIAILHRPQRQLRLPIRPPTPTPPDHPAAPHPHRDRPLVPRVPRRPVRRSLPRPRQPVRVVVRQVAEPLAVRRRRQCRCPAPAVKCTQAPTPACRPLRVLAGAGLPQRQRAHRQPLRVSAAARSASSSAHPSSSAHSACSASSMSMMISTRPRRSMLAPFSHGRSRSR
jgi:hypothetical protein